MRTPAEHVASIAVRNHVCAVPILDRDRRLLGVVSADDILAAVRMETTKCVYRLVGVLGLELKLSQVGLRDILAMVRARIPWLIVSLVISVFISGGIIRRFEDALAALPVIAAFIPALMGSVDNISLQSSTVLVRTLAQGRMRGSVSSVAPRGRPWVVRGSWPHPRGLSYLRYPCGGSAI